MNILSLIALRYAIIAYGTVVVFMFFPLIIVLLSQLLGVLSGCPDGVQLSNEYCTNGYLIHILSQAGWLLVFTVPFGMLLLILISIFYGLLYIVTKKPQVAAAFIMKKVEKKLRK